MAILITIKRPSGAPESQWIEQDDGEARRVVKEIRAKMRAGFDPSVDRFPWTVATRKMA
jgi:hypothetical protein